CRRFQMAECLCWNGGAISPGAVWLLGLHGSFDALTQCDGIDGRTVRGGGRRLPCLPQRGNTLGPPWGPGASGFHESRTVTEWSLQCLARYPFLATVRRSDGHG